MKSCRPLWVAASLLLLLVLPGCGGSNNDKFDPSQVSVTVSPSTTNVTAGGHATLQATVNNNCAGCMPNVLWGIQELQVNGATGAQCNWSGNTPPAGDCAYGTLEGTETSTVVFHAPSTTGTVHVVAQWTQTSNPPVVKTGTATITVQ